MEARSWLRLLVVAGMGTAVGIGDARAFTMGEQMAATATHATVAGTGARSAAPTLSGVKHSLSASTASARSHLPGGGSGGGKHAAPGGGKHAAPGGGSGGTTGWGGATQGWAKSGLGGGGASGGWRGTSGGWAQSSGWPGAGNAWAGSGKSGGGGWARPGSKG